MRREWGLGSVAITLAVAGVLAALLHSDGNLADGPAGCAGPAAATPDLEDARQEQWTFTFRLAEHDPTADVWVGFDQALTAAEVADRFGSAKIAGVYIAWEQRQGTFVKTQQAFDPIPADDPNVRAVAAHSLRFTLDAMRVDVQEALRPVDPSVEAGEPPLIGLLLADDAIDVIDRHRCTIYSLLPGYSGNAPLVPPSVAR